MYFLYILVAICLIVFVRYSLSMKQQQKLSERNQILSEERRKRELKKQEEIQCYVSTLENQYGKRGDYMDGFKFHIWVFPESRNVVIYKDNIEERLALSFQDILSCELIEERIKTGETHIPARTETTYTTTTSGKSMLGRAIVGAAVAGPVGAIIGGATAKRETTGVTTVTQEQHLTTYKTKNHVLIKYLNDGVEGTIVYEPYALEYAERAKTIIDSVLKVQ